MTTVQKVYNYTGASVDFTVPAGVTSVTFELWGASGGIGSTAAATPSHFLDSYFNTGAAAKANSGHGTNGCGYVSGVRAVTPGDVYHIYVGQNGKTGGSGGQVTTTGGAGGWNGGGKGGNGYGNPALSGFAAGGGGGATDVRYGGVALTDRILVAGGAGGGGGSTFSNSAGWTTPANPTTPVPPYSPQTYYVSGLNYGGYAGTSGAAGGAGGNAGGGGGATSGAGGSAGTSSYAAGSAGVTGVGGAGGNASSGTAGSGGVAGGGGGGGGYFGGGGGGCGAFPPGTTAGAGGGGGSNFIGAGFTSSVNVSHAFPPASRLASGYGGFAALTYLQPPNAPAITSPVDNATVPSTAGLEIDLSFSHPAGTPFATYDMRYGVRSSRVANTGFETNTTGYSAITNSSILRVTTQFHSGVASMSITATAGGDAIAGDTGTGTGGIAILGSAEAAVTAWVKSAATARNCVLEMDWWDSGGTLISTSVGTPVGDVTTGWTQISETFVAPSNAAFCRRRLRVVGAAASEVHWVDDWSFDSVTAWTNNAGNTVTAGSSSAAYTYAGGTFTAGSTYDIQSRVTDTDGDVGPWANVTVLPVAPPGNATITAPGAGSTQTTSPFNVTWTIPSGTQQSYQVQILDANGNVLVDSGVVVSATLSYSVNWTGIASQPVTVQVRYTTTTSGGQFSNYVTRAFTVNLSPPGTPTVAGATDSTAGTITLTVTVNDSPNTTASVHIYRTDITNGGSEIRVAAGLVPSGSPRKVIWTDYTPATRTTYRYRVRSNSAAGGYADA